MTHRCPTVRRSPEDIIGCGHEFNAEPDEEGFVDCPHCGLFFKADPREQALAFLRERFGGEFTSSLEREDGDRFIAVEDAGQFFATHSAPTSEMLVDAMSHAANDREQPSNVVGYIDLDEEELTLYLVRVVARVEFAGYSESVVATADDIRETLERIA